MLSGHREVLPQPVQKRETLGGEAGPLERRGCYAPSSDCTVFRGNYCLLTKTIIKKKATVGAGTLVVLPANDAAIEYNIQPHHNLQRLNNRQTYPDNQVEGKEGQEHSYTPGRCI